MKKSLSSIILAVLVAASQVHAADGPTFHSDFDKARAVSKSSGKTLITIFSASWCGPCKKMKKSVYPSSEVAPYHDKFVWAYLDADSSKNRGLMKQFGVNGIPHISFVSPGGELVGQARGAVSPSSFAKTLSSTLAKTGGPAPSKPSAPTTSAPPEPKKKGLFGIFKKKE